MNKIYLFIYFNSIIKKIKNNNLLLFLIIIYIINKIFLKNYTNNINTIFNYNNLIWDYLLILNNNNKSFLLFLLLLRISIIKNKIINKNLNNIIIILFKYILNFKFLSITKFVRNNIFININLTNGLILIHPIMMYLSYVYLIYFVINTKNIKIMNKIKKKKNLIKILNKKLFLFSILALFLGSYWSQQELNWGGWWNWDFVELIALIFFILITTISHVNNNIFNFLLTFKKKIIKYLILFFFLIRVDILNSVHSFNSFNSFIHNLNIYYLTFVILTVIFINKNYSKYYKNKNINTLIFLFLISLYSINLYIYWNIVLSFIYNNQYMDLTKNIKQFLVVNLSLFLIFNFKKLKTLNLLIISLMFLIFFSIIFNSDIDNITIKYNLYLLTLIIIIKDITNYKYNEKNIIHIFFIIFIICNIFNYNYQSYYCLINLNLNLNLLNNSNLLNSYNNYLISYYNNNNCLFINNYYCYNNNILFTSVFKETLVNNILLLLNKIKINYNIEKLFLIFNINNIFFYCFIFIFFTIKYKNKTIKKKDNIV